MKSRTMRSRLRMDSIETPQLMGSIPALYTMQSNGPHALAWFSALRIVAT